MVEQPGPADAKKRFEGLPVQVECVPISIAFQIAFHKQASKSISGQKVIKPPRNHVISGGSLEQGTGIEPASSAWEADVLPMY